MPDCVASMKDLTTIVGVWIAAVSLIYTACSTRLTLKTNRARFWLDLRDRFSRFDDIHLNLRPGGAWTRPDAGPKGEEEWAQVEAYMGLFEHCEVMLRDGLVDGATFRSIYRYRVENLLENPLIIQKKLIDRRDGWKDFLALLRRFELSDRVPPG